MVQGVVPFERVPEEPAVIETSEPATVRENPVNKVAADMLMLALSALSQRAVAALGALFSLLTVASAFWLWYLTPDPSPTQIISLTIYSMFVLAINWLVKRK